MNQSKNFPIEKFKITMEKKACNLTVALEASRYDIFCLNNKNTAGCGVRRISEFKSSLTCRAKPRTATATQETLSKKNQPKQISNTAPSAHREGREVTTTREQTLAPKPSKAGQSSLGDRPGL